ELIESINYIQPMKKIMIVLMNGTGRKNRRMKYCDHNLKSFTSDANFVINNAYDSMPPVFDPENRMLYLTNKYEYEGDASYQHFRALQNISHYPYGSFTLEDLPYVTAGNDPISSQMLYKNVLFQGDSYIFYAPKNRRDCFLFSKATLGGKYCEPVFLDDFYGGFDHLTTCVYNSTVYLLKKSPGASPNSNFYLSRLAPQVKLTGCASAANSLLISDPAQKSPSSYSSFDFTEKVNCIAGDDYKNLLYGTSDGLYLRNLDFGNVRFVTSGSGAGRVIFPPKFEHNGSYYKWHHFLGSIAVTSVFAEKGGVFWAGTADKGIFRSRDYGESWKQIESVFSNFNHAVGFIGRGPADKINKISLITTRYNLKNPNDITSVVPEHLVSIYNLGNNRIESSTVITRGQYKNMVSNPVISYDGSKIICYDGLSKKITIKKHNSVYENAFKENETVPPFKSGIYVSPGDTIEINAGRKFFDVDVNSRNHLCLPGGHYHYDSGPQTLFGQITYGAGGQQTPAGQYSRAASPYSGELAFSFANQGTLLGTMGYCRVRTTIDYKPEAVIDAAAKINSNVSNAFAAPDNKTVYFTSYDGDKVYSVSDINETASVQIKEYSKNILKPRGVIFTPKNRKGEFKAYVVCAKNIVDLFGNSLLPEISGIDIGGAAICDNGEIYFTDRTTKKLYKCRLSEEKTVYVTVKEAEESIAGSMPPMTLARKFHSWQAANEIRRGYMPNRNYIKYDYIYTSKAYPSGISAARSEKWQLKKTGDYETLNAYIVDEQLNVNGTLEIMAGTIVKFSTADKSVNFNDWSGRADSCIQVNSGGKLLIRGGLKESERVLFTSLDDNVAAPSAYSSGDLNFKSTEGLANPQLFRLKSGSSVRYCGPKYGDWGKSYLGGIIYITSSGSVINNLETR
ncbi:MAG TPA: hypothetical protein PKL57_14450, partial [Candidatus Wallbacteria bacterium]|nr:hypothetical protein [Candidatus Wallbacteria bacterium]